MKTKNVLALTLFCSSFVVASAAPAMAWWTRVGAPGSCTIMTPWPHSAEYTLWANAYGLWLYDSEVGYEQVGVVCNVPDSNDAPTSAAAGLNIHGSTGFGTYWKACAHNYTSTASSCGPQVNTSTGVYAASPSLTVWNDGTKSAWFRNLVGGMTNGDILYGYFVSN